MLKYIVSVHYEEFIFTDGCAALAYAEISKRTSTDDVRVEIKIIKEEKKEGEDK